MSLPALTFKQGSSDAALNLQSLIEHVYRSGRFPIDYDDSCDPPLQESDAAWARGLLGRSDA